MIPTAQAPCRPNPPLSTTLSPSLDPQAKNTPAAELVAVPRRRRVSCHVLWTRTHSDIPSPDPVSSSRGYQRWHHTEGEERLPPAPQQRQHLPEGEQNSPKGSQLVSRDSHPGVQAKPNSVANFCSTGPKEEQGMHYRNSEAFTPETGALLCSWTPPATQLEQGVTDLPELGGTALLGV